MPGQLPGTLKKPHWPVGGGRSPGSAGCQRQSPFRQTRSRVGVASRWAAAGSQIAVTPAGNGAAKELSGAAATAASGKRPASHRARTR
jgi:hypothetical protein